MLTSELVLKLGRMSAFLALVERDLKGRFVLCDAAIAVPFGNMITFSDGPVLGRFSSDCMKCDVTPESRIIVEAFF